MTPTKHTMVNIKQVKQRAVSHWTLGKTHGLSHWERVERNGMLLATTDCDPTIILINDGYDRDHGSRAARMMETLRDNLLRRSGGRRWRRTEFYTKEK